MNQADTAWMLISTALVLLMTPALAFFYGGLVRPKNALNTMMMSFISLGFVGVLWALIGYSLALTAGNNWIGDLSLAFLNGVGLDAMGAVVPITIPHALYMAFQATFCIITAALICAFPEKLVNQIAVSAMQLDHVEPDGDGPAGRLLLAHLQLALVEPRAQHVPRRGPVLVL